MSVKEFKKRINITREEEKKRDTVRGYVNKKNRSIFRINNINVEIVWGNNISIREKDYSIQALKEIELQNKIKGDKIELSKYCDTVNDFKIIQNLSNKILLETV